jgi:14-3-3 protein epsilon
MDDQENPVKYDKNTFLALLAQQCSRYEEMFEYLENVVIQRNKDLSEKERELLGYGYVSYISSKRKALHIVMAYETKEKKNESSLFISYIQEYRKTLESDITQCCQKIINKLDSLFVKKAETNEIKLFYKKLKGDFNRYIAEYAKDELREKVMKDGLTAYQEAMNLSKDLPIMNRNVIGLYLNMSLFYYEVINEKKNAIKIANECITKVDKELPNFNEDNENGRIIMAIIELIRENLEHWNVEEEEQNK